MVEKNVQTGIYFVHVTSKKKVKIFVKTNTSYMDRFKDLSQSGATAKQQYQNEAAFEKKGEEHPCF